MSAPEDVSKAVDMARLRLIYDDDRGAILAVLQLAAQETRGLLDRARALAERTQRADLLLALHEIKGMAANVGATELHAAAAAAESHLGLAPYAHGDVVRELAGIAAALERLCAAVTAMELEPDSGENVQ